MMKNDMRKKRTGVALATAILLSAGMLSCSPGLGSEVDLHAPQLAITSHENLDYVGVPFVLSGTAVDNIKVDTVKVFDGRTGALYATAAINGQSWYAELSLPEGDTSVRVVAYDQNKNSSYQSVKQLTLLVDSTPPVIETVEIRRPGGWIQYLLERETLEASDPLDYLLADSFQNEQLTLNAELDDESNVNNATVNLLDNSGTVLFSKVSAASSAFNPAWTITHDELVAINPSYATGRHYFRVTVETQDAAGNPTGELASNTDQFLWLCWYPESDYPRINCTTAADGSITIPKDASMPVEFWDDDGLGIAHARLMPLADWNAISGSTDNDKINSLIANPSRSTILGSSQDLTGNPRQRVVNIAAGTQSGDFRLVLLCRDEKTTSANLWYGRSIPVQVTDEDSPIVIVDSPEENTFPTISSGTEFVINGAVLDNRGATVLRVAWIPAGIPGQDAVLESTRDDLKNSTVSSGASETLPNGVVIRGIPLAAATTRSVGGQVYYSRNFSAAFDILSSFMYEGVNENDSKLFMFYTTDEDANDEWRIFRLPGNSALPGITFTYPAQDLQVHSNETEFDLSFTVSTPGDLPLDSVVLQDTTGATPVTETFVQTGTDFTMTKTVADMAGWADPERRTWQVTVRDILGNESMQSRTVIFTRIPALTRITSGAINGTFKEGDEIMLQAVFSNAVRVPAGSEPRLRLRYSAGDTVDKYAEYHSGSGTNTLYFRFIVPAGAQSADLRSWTTPIDLDGGSILSTEGSGTAAHLPGLDGHPAFVNGDGNNLQDTKNIALDGVSPEITGLTFTDRWYREGETIQFSLTLNEQPLVSGDPELRLVGGIAASFVRTAGTTVIFEYTVQASDNFDSIGWNLQTCMIETDRLMITDLAGNPLSLGTTGTGSAGGIDTGIPPAPVIQNPAAGAYNTDQSLILNTPAASGSPETAEYSLDGGLTWNVWTTPVLLADGDYVITARRIDAAGNVSPIATPRAVEIGKTFPAIIAISCENPDGVYTEDDVLTFKVSFDRPVHTTSAAGLLTFAGGASTLTASIQESAADTTALYFERTIPAGSEMYPVQISSLDLSGVVDHFGNTNAAPAITGLYTARPALAVDSASPQITARSPSSGAVLARNGSGESVLTLTFDENVWVESGTIEVYRSGAWLIPPVLTESEFAAVYYNSALTEAQRSALMQTVNGSPALHPLTGQPLGPYKKTTHGLTLQGGSWVPDTATKYVLDFETDLDNAAIRDAFEAADYHRYVIDVTSFRVTGSGTNTITVVLPEPLPHGREWACDISAASFRDGGGNTSAAESWQFWSDKTATPVVRIDRYSQGEGAVQPLATATYNAGGILTAGSLTGEETFGNRDKTTVPSGYVRVRIDCETPNAEISFAAKRESTATITTGGLAANSTRTSANADIADADLDSLADLSALATAMTYTAYFPLGDGEIDTAGKYYVAASATKDATGGEPALADSDPGYEGAFKSVIMYRDPGSGGSYTRFQGSNIEGGMPTISGFPLRDADPDLRFTKHSYQDGLDWYWHSWEIVCDWYNQSARTNWQTNPNYILNTYGDYLYSYQKTYYGGGPWTDAQ